MDMQWLVYANTIKDPYFPLKFKTMQIITIKDGQLYTLSYGSEASQYGRYLPTNHWKYDRFSYIHQIQVWKIQITMESGLVLPNIMRIYTVNKTTIVTRQDTCTFMKLWSSNFSRILSPQFFGIWTLFWFVKNTERHKK